MLFADHKRDESPMVRAMSGVALPADDPWASYARTSVEVRTGVPFVVHPARVGEVGAWPWPFEEAVHILTAWDPGDERPDEMVNRRRQASLEDEVRADASSLWRAIGMDPESGHGEEGVLVCGVTEDAVLGLGRRYRQDAIFRWTRHDWSIVACQGPRRVSLGWRLERI